MYLQLEAQVGAERVRLVSGNELAMAPRITHRVDDHGASLELTLADGTHIRPGDPVVVFNRLTHTPAPQFEASDKVDLEYATMELHATWLSMLAGLPRGRVINPPHPQGMAGRPTSQLEVLELARRVGLPVREYAASTNARRMTRRELLPHPVSLVGGHPVTAEQAADRRLVGRGSALFLEPLLRPVHALVAGRRVVGPVPQELWGGLLEMRPILGVELMEITLGVNSEGQLRVSQLSTTPTSCEPAHISAVTELLLEAGP